jgi:hypothetical protein
MGQYSQWFYHREVDQQLQRRLDLLAQELHALQEQATLLEGAASSIDNPILQAIAMQHNAVAPLEDTPSLSSTEELLPVHNNDDDQSAKSVSPALFAWSHLPNLDTRNVSLATQELARPEPETGQQPSLAQAKINLLPSDMATFIDAHAQTLPQIQVPRSLHTDTPIAQTSDAHKLAPSTSAERTDASIRRWLERWGKQLPDSPPRHNIHKPQEAQKHE